ncbi:phospho-N-acetylmuramoyl-pentapeptide-transferase [Chlamydiifrater volucris]|uniref:phospho-N-acetylmuramoyl-pentapeptide- transferase n=1 Tax=Chlamydiifrater volucris TaxID=2681470 RepID=UPI001BCE0A73|nr:phospho-N-acetylmuramoyl-pentapeptide-transferase [Chlamydiifrater volucris]
MIHGPLLSSLLFERAFPLVVGGFSFAFLAFLALINPFIRWLKKEKIQDTPEKEYCERLKKLHEDKSKTPTMGGVLMAMVLIATCFLSFGVYSPMAWLLIFSIICWASLGFVDDLVKQKRKKGHGLSAKKKFVFQVLIASITVFGLIQISSSDCPREVSSVWHQEQKTDNVCAADSFFIFNVPFIKEGITVSSFLGRAFLFCLAILAIVGSVNAVNLTDGLDGLASGCMLMASTCFIIVMILSEMFSSHAVKAPVEILLLLSSTVGVCSGFFLYNKFPARIFMGDTGSMMLGGVLGTCVVSIRQELLLLIIGGVFVAEALSVILQIASVKIRNKRIFLCSPLHHHFEYKGIPENRVVVGFWYAGAILGVIGVLSAVLSFL